MTDRDRDDLRRRIGSLEAVVNTLVDVMERSHLRGLALERLLLGFNFEVRREHERLRRIRQKFLQADSEPPPHDD